MGSGLVVAWNRGGEALGGLLGGCVLLKAAFRGRISPSCWDRGSRGTLADPSQVKMLRPRGGKGLAQGHTAIW